MEIIITAPYILRVLASLFLILLVNKITSKLWLSILSGILLLGVWLGHSVRGMLLISWASFSSANNLCLLLVVFQVIWLSSQMSLTGIMKELVETVKSHVSQRTSMALLPAVIGLLPMPGGAIFSAPLVDDCDSDNSVDPLLKTKINYWFRHVWEYWWPLYPGVLVAVEITGLSILQFMILMIPLSLFSIMGGYIFLLRKIDENKNSNELNVKEIIKQYIRLLYPILTIIMIYTLINIFLPSISTANKYIPMGISIFIAQVLLQIARPLKILEWKEIIISIKTINLVIIVIIVLVYGAFIENKLPDGSLVMSHIQDEMSLLGIPIVVLCIAIPFISGLTTGIAVGFVGASFPIVMSLLGSNPQLSVVLSTTVLAFGSGYMGMILSPVHVCLIVTNEHFKTRIIDSLIRLTKPSLIVMSGSVIMYILIKTIFDFF